MIREGCEQEIAWGHYSIGDGVAGLTCEMITDYVQYLGNLRCTNLGFEKLYDGH
jgi:ribonucleoside-diphosphate reductase beta chain